ASTRNFQRQFEKAIQYASGKPIINSRAVTENARRIVSQKACQSINTDSVTAAASILGIVTAAMFIHHRFFMYSPLSIAPGGFVNGDPGEALTIVRKLADGVHPETGEVLQSDCLYNHPQAVRDCIGQWGRSNSRTSGSARKNFCPATPARPGRIRRTRKSVKSYAGNDVRANPQSHQWFHHFAAGAAGKDFRGAASPTAMAGGTPFTVTVSSSVSQAYSFNIVGVGNDPSAITHSAPVTFTALPKQNFDFTIVTIPPTSASVPAGQAASSSIDVNPTTGAFPNDVTFSCSKLPALTTCVFSPAHVLSGSG